MVACASFEWKGAREGRWCACGCGGVWWDVNRHWLLAWLSRRKMGQGKGEAEKGVSLGLEREDREAKEILFKAERNCTSPPVICFTAAPLEHF